MLDKTYNIGEIRKHDYKYSRVIEHILKNNSWKKKDGNVTYSDKNSKSTIKTYLDGTDEIFLKHKLANRFHKYAFIPETIVIENKNDLTKIPISALDDDIWFLKPSSMLIGSGEGIEVIKTIKNQDFRDRIQKYIKPNIPYVLQRNVNNPFLINDIKFDLRIYGLIVYTPYEFASYVLNIGTIRYAVSKYVKSNIKESMMTNISLHEHKSDKELEHIKHKLTDLYDENFRYYKYLDSINNIFSCVIKCIFNIIRTKKEKDTYGFVTVGLDILLAKDGIYLIEVNQHPTLYVNSSTIEEVFDYKLHCGLNRVYIKDFYTLVFDAIINNKLVNRSYGDWILSFYSKFIEVKCREKIVINDNQLSLYKYSLITKDINRLYNFINKQPHKNLELWTGTNNFTKLMVITTICNNYGNTKSYYAVLLDSKIVGLVGLSYRTDKYAKDYKNNYFTNIIIDSEYGGKGLGTKSMKLFIEYIKKIIHPKVIYATIYNDNIPSIKLHKKLGYEDLGIFDSYKGRDIIIMQFDLK